MLKRLAIIIVGLITGILLHQLPVLAGGIHGGIEWQYVDGQPSANTLRFNWSATKHWSVSGTYRWEDRNLSAGFAYKQRSGSLVSSYVGLGFRDLLNEAAPEYDFADKTEIITGLEVNLGRNQNSAFILMEIRAVGSTILNHSDSEALKTIVSMSLNFRIPNRSAAPVKIPDNISESDFDLLTRLVEAEAGAEPYEGKVAVAAVVFNRMLSSSFPNTIREIIYQENQFSSLPKLPYVQPGESCRRAVIDALNGMDPSNGALYFYNPATSSPEGLRFFNSGKLRVTARIGNHVFLTE